MSKPTNKSHHNLKFQYNNLEAATQKSIAEELDRTPAEVSKKLEDVRTRYAF